MGARREVTRRLALAYRSGSRSEKAAVLEELCGLMSWHRNHARKALGPQRARRRAVRAPVYGPEVLEALRVRAVIDPACGKQVASFLNVIVPVLREAAELDVDDVTAAALCSMSAATIDRRLAADRARVGGAGSVGDEAGGRC